MPQASQSDQEWAKSEFGNLDSFGPMVALQGKGYVLSNKWTWTKPSPEHVITEYELRCMGFLCDEWDFGWLS